ncbi:protein mono-ADP-ribosyltransferase PARP14-like isoform X2 [Patiria miniata]|uniref:Poly [ADP-ribose] polymerase n=1 Tax=Patiria miniata TaxID=46514 RepID=A0A914B633_PATMI|nr:protein mono-ADP-ribosyltransferase PARP14-like isoform X2 [Patiria miniata]
MDASRRSIYVGLPRTESIEKKLSVLEDKLTIYFQKSRYGDVDSVLVIKPDRGDKLWMEVTFDEPSGVEQVLSVAQHELKLEGYDLIPLEVRTDLPPKPTESSSDDGEESFVLVPEGNVDKETLKDGGLTKEASAPNKDKNQSPSQTDGPPSRPCSSRIAATLHLPGVASSKTGEVPPGPHSAHHTPDPAEMSSLQSTVGTTVQGEKHYEEGTDEDLYSPNGSKKQFMENQTPYPAKKLKMEASHSQDIANKDLHGRGDDCQKQASSQQQPRASGDRHQRQPVEPSKHQLEGGGATQKGNLRPQQMGAAAQDQMNKQDQDHHGPQNTTKLSGPQKSKKSRRKQKGKKADSEISEQEQTTAGRRGHSEAPLIPQEQVREENSPDEKEEEEEEEEEEEKFVEVTGFNQLSSSSEEMLRMHFENPKRSGGGDIKTWEHDPKAKAIKMTFENPSLTSKVIAKKHKVGGDNLVVRQIVKKKPRPRPVKKRCLFLCGIPDGCNSELVAMFIENRSGTDEFKIQYGEMPGTALCTFKEDIQDFENVIKRISSKVLSGAYLTAEKVKESDCILVKGVSPRTSLEMIELYFDNKKKSGGTGVREVQQGPTDTQAIVYYEDWKVVHDVLSKRSPHKVAGTELLVEEYHECLGRLSQLDAPTPHVPKPVTVQVQKPIMEFIFGKGQHTKKTLTQKLRDAKAILKWPDGDDKTTARLEPLLEDGQRQSSWLKWSETATQILTDSLNRCKSSRIAVPSSFWKDAVDKINQLGTKSFSIQFDASTHLVTLVGEQQDVHKGHTDIDGIIKELRAKTEYEAQQIKEDITLTEEKSQPFIICGIKDKIEKDFPNLKITVISSQDKLRVVFEGSRKIVQEAELSMRRQMDSLEKVELKTGPNKVKFVLNVIDKIHEILGSQGSRAACKGSDDGKIIISGATKKDTTKAKAYIDQEIEEGVIPIKSQAAMDVLQNQTGQRLLDGINKQKFVMAAISSKGNVVELAGFKTNLGETKQKIMLFLKDNVIIKTMVPANKNKICLIENFYGEDLVNIMKNTKNHVKIQPQKGGRRKGFVIQGNEEGSEAASQAISSLIDRIKEQPYPVSKTGMAQLFREDKGKKFLETLEKEYLCVIRENVQEDSDDEAEVEGDAAVRPMVSTRVLCRIALPNGFTLKVCIGDLTRQQVDCIVNAANTELKHVGGLAYDIVKAGGRAIQTESEQILIRSKRRQLYVGEPVHTTGGKLPCKKVIHVAGPKWPHHRGDTFIPDDDEPSYEEHLLYNGVIACLKLANKLNMQSIAIPAISTGVYGFPVDLAAKQILNAVAEFCQSMPNPTLTEIHFTNNDPPTCDVFKKAVMDRFSQFQEDEDGTDVDKGSRGASLGPPIVDDVPQPPPVSAPAPAPRFTSSGQNILTTMEGINITLKKGSITSEMVDVLVNTAGSDMQLGNGAVSKAILQAAGQALQLECSTVTSARGKIPAGEFIQTGPAALTCKKVYHCVCESYSSPARAEQFLKKLVLSLMEDAEQNEMLSIAIPALGTGNLNYPADVTARVMYESVLEFSSQHPNGVLKDIRFVVYDKDVKTIQCFESEIQRLLNPASPGGATGFTPSGHGRKLKKPGSSSGPTDRQAYSAIQRDATGMLQTKIGSVCLQVGQGDLVKETTDGIVNSVGARLDLNGPVSQAILAKGGKNIVQECDFHRNKDPRKLMYVTTAGRLQSSCIFHVVTPRTVEEIKTVVLRSLNEAEKIKLKSVSFPALGTGQAGQSVADCASAIMTAVGEFAVRKKPQYLRLIRLVIFQRDMVSGFQDALQKEVGTSFKEQKGFFSKGLGKFMSALSGAISGATADASTDDESLQETIILNIYAMDMPSVKKAADKIDQFQDEQYTSENLSDEHGMIDKMTDAHGAILKEIERKHHVKIKCCGKGQAKSFNVRGPTLSVKDACIQIQALFTRIQKEELELQQREHLFKEVQWKYSTQHGMEAYDPEVNAIIEEAHKNNRPSVILNLEDGNVTINFQAMEEISPSGNLVVQRIDMKKAASFEMPSNWIPMTKDKHFAMVQLTAGTPEYTTVETQFQSTGGGHTIREIHRIQNRDLLMQYQARKGAMEARLGRTNIEETLFHGTDEQTCDKINKFGFNRSFCGKNATVFGNGTYFAVDSNYSARSQYAKPNANGVQHMYLTKVLVGDYIRGNQGIITPPNKPSHPDQQYDCVVDNVNQPGIYVIFHDAQAYAEYLIKFQ